MISLTKKSDPLFSPDESKWQCAVMVLLVEKNFLLLIKRTEEVPSHKGQYAFPGGYKKISEHTPWSVALREFSEETQISPDLLTFHSTLPLVYSGQKIPIVPIMATFQEGITYLQKHLHSNGEWDKAILLHLDSLKEDSNWMIGQRIYQESHRPIYFHLLSPQFTQIIQPLPIDQMANQYDVLWGVTAKILFNLR